MTDEAVSDLANRVLARARQAARAMPTVSTAVRREATYSSARPDDRDPSRVADAISSLVTDRGWQAATAIGRIWGEWASLVGPTLAEHVTPEAFDRTTGLLTLRADSTAWATQVRMLSGQLRKRLQAELPGGLVHDISVLGPDVGPRQRGRLRVKGRGPRDTYG
ncbi:MAG: DciA family protein [Candidatus Nanopelagicales bacterium]|jgi:predicted nucleic acid-binding Zn ribbon protein|nr:DciA family protein [Candidatus Nanopelagicales bacterium]MCU0297867.1 DciA family protein [Candidatus Nanopelagicales bacterium]